MMRRTGTRFSWSPAMLSVLAIASVGPAYAAEDAGSAPTVTLVQNAAAPAGSQSATDTGTGLTAGGWSMPDFVNQKYLLNWGTWRDDLAAKGIKFAFGFEGWLGDDVQHPPKVGGQVQNWDRVRGTVDVDFSKFTAWQGLTYHITGLWQAGQSMGTKIGALASPDPIASENFFRLDSTYLQQVMFNGVLTVTGGIMASQDWFGLQDYIGNFVNEPMYYNFGNSFASWDPASGPGAQIKVQPTENVFFHTGYFLPSNNLSQDGFHYVEPHNGHGTVDAEIGFYTDPNAPTTRKSYPGIIHLGVIYEDGQYMDYSKPSSPTKDQYQVYLQANQPVFRTDAGSNRGLDLTFGVNTGAYKSTEVPTEYTAGGTFNGPLPSRPLDKVSVGLVVSKVGSAYNNWLSANNMPTATDEKLIEVNYLATLTPWLYVQPFVMHYVNTGGTASDSTVVGGFFNVKF